MTTLTPVDGAILAAVYGAVKGLSFMIHKMSGNGKGAEQDRLRDVAFQTTVERVHNDQLDVLREIRDEVRISNNEKARRK